MDQTKYRTCITPYMKERQMCLGAKICSGKAKDREEAQKLCDEAALLPKAPRKARGKCKIDIAALTTCIINSLDGTEISQVKLAPIISACTGQKVAISSRERFIKQCFRDNASTNDGIYDLKEAQKLRSLCTIKWKEQEAA